MGPSLRGIGRGSLNPVCDLEREEQSANPANPANPNWGLTEAGEAPVLAGRDPEAPPEGPREVAVVGEPDAGGDLE